MKRGIPRLTTDGEAEAFLERDLSGLDFARLKPGQLEFEREDDQPAARLVPSGKIDRERVQAAIAKPKELRAGSSLGGLSWKELRDRGRR